MSLGRHTCIGPTRAARLFRLQTCMQAIARLCQSPIHMHARRNYSALMHAWPPQRPAPQLSMPPGTHVPSNHLRRHPQRAVIASEWAGQYEQNCAHKWTHDPLAQVTYMCADRERPLIRREGGASNICDKRAPRSCQPCSGRHHPNRDSSRRNRDSSRRTRGLNRDLNHIPQRDNKHYRGYHTHGTEGSEGFC